MKRRLAMPTILAEVGLSATDWRTPAGRAGGMTRRRVLARADGARAEPAVDLALRRGYTGSDCGAPSTGTSAPAAWPIAARPAASAGKPLRLLRAARRVRLDEHVHRVFPALHPWRRRRISRGRAFLFQRDCASSRLHEGEWNCLSRPGSLVSLLGKARAGGTRSARGLKTVNRWGTRRA